MVQSAAKTVEEYLTELSPERREAIAAVREMVLAHLPAGYEEVMNWGMITYQVPLEVEPNTYNNKPLMYAALASQKNHMAVYLSGIYQNAVTREKFEQEYRATGKRYDVGKSCVRFRRLEDLPLEVIGKAIASTEMTDFVRQYHEVRAAYAQQRDATKEKRSATKG